MLWGTGGRLRDSKAVQQGTRRLDTKFALLMPMKAVTTCKLNQDKGADAESSCSFSFFTTN